MTELQIELSHPEDADLLKRCAEALKATYVRVGTLQRFGNSGAELFLAEFGDGQRSGYARVVKIASSDLIDEEVNGVAAIRNYFVDAHEIEEVVDGDERSAIIYRLISADPDSTDTAPLHDVLCKNLEEEEEERRLETILGHLYDGCCRIAHKGNRKRFVLGEEYQRYRRHDRCAPRLSAAIGPDARDDIFSYLGAEIVDPRHAVGRLEGLEIDGVLGAVHGDLHSNNVMLDHKSEPHLIDFAWARDDAHVIKDFVLMECSLRFLVFPSFSDLDTQLLVDQALLREQGWTDVEALAGTSPLSPCYARLGSLLGIIRGHAAAACGSDFNFEVEYLAPQLFMLYGLLAYNDYAFYSASRAAGLIGHKLLASLT
jgi:hypothetical protein